jgi:hypothetical protein
LVAVIYQSRLVDIGIKLPARSHPALSLSQKQLQVSLKVFVTLCRQIVRECLNDIPFIQGKNLAPHAGYQHGFQGG